MNGVQFLFWVIVAFVALLFVLEQGVEWVNRLVDWWERGKR